MSVRTDIIPSITREHILSRLLLTLLTLLQDRVAVLEQLLADAECRANSAPLADAAAADRERAAMAEASTAVLTLRVEELEAMLCAREEELKAMQGNDVAARTALATALEQVCVCVCVCVCARARGGGMEGEGVGGRGGGRDKDRN